MTYIVTEPCIGTKDRACVEVCPVECFYEGTDQLYIHPEECIDCAACEPVCPVTAIFPEDSVPDNQKSYIEKNYKFIEQYKDAPHALTKAMLGDQDNFATTLTADGKTITLPPPPAGFGGPAPPPPKAEAAPAPKAEAPPAPKVEAPPAPKAEAAPAPKAEAAPAATAPAAAPARTVAVAGDPVVQVAEAAAAAAEAAARAAEAAAAAVRMLLGKADGRTVSGAPSAPTVQPQAAPAAKPAEVKTAPKSEAAPAAPAKRQAEAPQVTPSDPASFERAKEVLYALIDFESGARPIDTGELARAEQTAAALFDEIANAVGKRDYTLQDLEKKDVTLRQKLEFANTIVDHVAKARLHIEVRKQRVRARKQIPGAVMSFAIAGLCAALGFVYALNYSVPPGVSPTLTDLLNAPFTPEGFMPFLGFNLLAGLFGLFGLLAVLKMGRAWAEVHQMEALGSKEFGAASLRPRRSSWLTRLKIESQRIIEAQRMLEAYAAKKR